MSIDHVILRRPGLWVTAATVVAILILATACGSASEPATQAPETNAVAQTTAGDGGDRLSTPEPSGHSHDSQTGHDGQSGHDSDVNTAPGDAVVINLPIANRATALTRADLRVNQGDTVHLMITSDEHGEIHLHGYDLTAQVSPDHPGELTFDAGTAGAFGINFHAFAAGGTADGHGHDDDHHETAATTTISELPISVAITAEPGAHGGVDVNIATEGFRFAPESVDLPHEPGVGHAHIYLNGVKLARVFEPHYHIADLAPGQNLIRVSLNSNDHSELVFDGAKVESTTIVIVPDASQSTGNGDSGHDPAGHDHGDEREIVAEVHLGNLEVYP